MVQHVCIGGHWVLERPKGEETKKATVTINYRRNPTGDEESKIPEEGSKGIVLSKEGGEKIEKTELVRRRERGRKVNSRRGKRRKELGVKKDGYAIF